MSTHDRGGVEQFHEMAIKTGNVVTLDDFIPCGVLKPHAAGLAHAQSNALVSIVRAIMNDGEQRKTATEDVAGQMVVMTVMLLCGDEEGKLFTTDEYTTQFIHVNRPALAALIFVASVLSVPKAAEHFLQAK
jgi:hypothetical protein